MAGPERIDRFEVEAVLGAGAFATVWLARDPVLDLRVAVKVLADNWSRDPDIRRRFIDEARVLWQANSPRIVRVHNVGELPDGRPYFVMTWADRGTLRQRIDTRLAAGAAFTVAESCSIVAEMARAVDDVHGIGRIHRDLKPGNVLLRTRADRNRRPILGLAADEQLVLADFGLAREIEASAITLVSGSPAYVAPEQAAGLDQLTERADLFPLGLMAVELMTGDTPGSRATMAEAAATDDIDVGGHLQRNGVAVPPPMLDYLRRLVAIDPRHRPSSAAEVADTLQHMAAAASGAPAPAPAYVAPAAVAPAQSATPTQLHLADSHPPRPDGRPGTATPPLSRPVGAESQPPATRKNGLLIGLGSLAVAAVAGVALLFLLSGGGDGGTSDAGSTTTATSTPTTGTTTTTSSIAVEDVSVETRPTALQTGEPPPIPLPVEAVVKSDDDLRTLANVARPVGDLVAFYQSVGDPAWTIGEVTTTDGRASFEMTSTDRVAVVTLEPTALGAGDGITQIEAVYRDQS